MPDLAAGELADSEYGHRVVAVWFVISFYRDYLSTVEMASDHAVT